MRLSHLHQKTRPFRYGGFWLLALSLALALTPPPPVPARSALQLPLAVLFCALWPWAADRLRARRPANDRLRLELAAYTGEAALAAFVLAWASVPPLVGFTAAVCVLAGAAALAGWRLLVPSLCAGFAGGALGAAVSPAWTSASTPAADGICLVLLFGYALALAHISFRQAQRLDRHRQNLAEKSAALERINGRMQRYLPPSLRARVARSPDEPCRWERRWLTIVFVDLVGFTELTERLEAELLAGMLDEYLGTLIPAAERRGGEVSKLLGDGMLVVFGLRDDDGAEPAGRPERVRAAAAFCGALPEILADLAAKWRSRGEPVVLRMRAGIASGLCTLGDRGSAERLDFTLVGPAVNLASRLQARAGVDGVLLDEASAALAEPYHPVGAPQPLDVKGIGAVRAYPLLPATVANGKQAGAEGFCYRAGAVTSRAIDGQSVPAGLPRRADAVHADLAEPPGGPLHARIPSAEG